MLEIENFAQRTTILKQRAETLLSEVGYQFDFSSSEVNSAITIVFAGQYSAGKSSILKMLTGNEDIAVGSGITTQVAHSYNWNGLEIIDTPGIHTEQRPDHDEISYNAIANADILVFVVTNELFDDHMGKHFRKLAIEKDKAGEMILVVNKMEREANGNTPESQKIKSEDLKKVIAPYKPEQLNLCFLDAESYLQSFIERDEDPEYADELLAYSGYEHFIDVLNKFVERNGIFGKLTTLLYQIDERIQGGLRILEPNSDDDVHALEEQLLQQRHIYAEARHQMKYEVSNIFIETATEIRNMGLEVANQISEQTKKEDAEALLEEYQKKVERCTEKCQEEARKLAVKRLDEVSAALDDLENSEFSCNLKTRLSNRFNKLPEKVQNILNQIGPNAENAGKTIVGQAYKAGINSGMKLTNFSGSAIHEMVLNVGHFFGHSFKPWEAVKLTKGVAIAGHALAAFGVVFSIAMHAKGDYDELKLAEQMKENRQNIRSGFNSVAKELEAYAKNYVENIIANSLDRSISELDNSITEIRSTRTDRSERYKQLELLQQDCICLIQDIHKANNYNDIVI